MHVQGMENVLWACATMGFVPEQSLLEAVSQHACARMHEFEQQSTVLLIWAYAKFDHHPGMVLTVDK